MVLHKPTNLAPFKRVINKLNRILHSRCVQGRDFDDRVYYIAAWCYWLLWDLRASPKHPRDSHHMIDPKSVQKYPKYNLKTGFKQADVPPNWVEISLEVLVDNEIIFDNCRVGDRRRYRPSNLLEKYWQEMSVLEHRFSPYDDKDVLVNIEVTRRLKKLEMVVRHLCKITGADFSLEDIA